MPVSQKTLETHFTASFQRRNCMRQILRQRAQNGPLREDSPIESGILLENPIRRPAAQLSLTNLHPLTSNGFNGPGQQNPFRLLHDPALEKLRCIAG